MCHCNTLNSRGLFPLPDLVWGHWVKLEWGDRCCWNHLLLLPSFDIPPFKDPFMPPCGASLECRKVKEDMISGANSQALFVAIGLLPLPSYFHCCLHNLNSDHLSLWLFQTPSRWLFAALRLQSLSWLPTCDQDLILLVCPFLDSYLFPIASLLKNQLPSQQLRISPQYALSHALPSSPYLLGVLNQTVLKLLKFFHLEPLLEDFYIFHFYNSVVITSKWKCQPSLMVHPNTAAPRTYSHGFLWIEGT